MENLLYQNKVPIYEIISGASIAFAAILLIIPGFLTDLTGFILLVPFTRKILFKIILDNKTSKSKQKGKDDINKLGIYAKFECKEIILPPKKPKKPVKMVNFVDLPKGLKNGH